MEAKLNVFRIYNGMEFVLELFTDIFFFKKYGIKGNRTGGIRQQNGTVERINKIILERLRCLLGVGLPKCLWVKLLLQQII